MSILLNKEIYDNYINGSIIIKPFDKSQIGPNSYDVRIGDKLKIYDNDRERELLGLDIILDVSKPNPASILSIPKDGFILSVWKASK